MRPSSLLLSVIAVSLLCASACGQALQPEAQTGEPTIAAKDAYISQKLVDLLYGMAKRVADFMDANGIRYWAEGGTALGIERHGGLIPWDDDLDVGISASDAAKFEASMDQLKVHHICATKWYYGFKVYYCDGSLIDRDVTTNTDPKFVKTITVNGVSKEYQPYNFPFLDIFAVDIKDGKSVYSGTRLFENCWWDADDISPSKLRKCDFGPVAFSCAATTAKYFERCYGVGGADAAYTGRDHAQGRDARRRVILDDNKFAVACPSNAMWHASDVSAPGAVIDFSGPATTPLAQGSKCPALPEAV